MKKKVALLLVLAMVMSMLPMNLFAARGAVTPILPNVRPVPSTATGVLNHNAIAYRTEIFEAHINMADLASRVTTPHALRLQFRLEGGNEGNTRFPNFNQEAGGGNANNWLNMPGNVPGPWAGTAGTDNNGNFRDVGAGNRPVLPWGTPGANTGLLAFEGIEEGRLDVSEWHATSTGRAGSVFLTYFNPDVTIGAAGVTQAGWIIPPNAQGFVTFQVPISVGDSNARLIVEELDASGNVVVTLLNQALVAGAGLGQGVTIEYGDAVNFDVAAPLGSITIRENSLGGPLRPTAAQVTLGTARLGHVPTPEQAAALTQNVAIRLTAPRDYVWHHRGIDVLGRSAGINVRSQFGGIHIVSGSVEHSQQNNANANVLIINLRTQNAGGNIGNLLDALIIENLWLIPTEGAPRTGNVNINVEIGRDYAHYITSGPNAGAVTDGRSIDGRVTNFIPTTGDYAGQELHRGFQRNAGGSQGDWSNARYARNNFTVAVRRPSGVDIEGPADIPTLFSGRVTTDWLNGGYHTIRLQENVPGALVTGVASAIEFITPQGVFITDAQFRIHPHDGGIGIEDWTSFEGDGAGFTNVFPGSTLGAVGSHVTRLHFTPQTNSTRLRHVDVRFRLSVEAGFVHTYGEDVIAIGVNGPGFAGRVDVAYVEDPVFVEGITPVAVDTANIFNVVDPIRVDNVVIHELEAGYFQPGDRIWVYAVGTQLGRAIPWQWASIAFDTNPVAVVNTADSGLTLNNGTLINLNIDGATVQAIEFTVRNSSNNEPGVITLVDNFIFGNISPGVDYHLIVTGPAIAENSHIVFAAGHTADGLEDNLPAMTDAQRSNPSFVVSNVRGLFNSLPFATPVVYFYDFLEDFGPDVGPGDGTGQLPGQPLPPAQRPAVWLNSEIPHTAADGTVVDEPVVFRHIAGMGVGFVSLRVFADLVGADILMDYPVAGQVTISGVRSDGVPVSVTVATGNRMIGVNTDGTHVFWDVAELSGAATGVPSGSIYTVNLPPGRLFLPFRAVANAFAYDLRTEGPFIVFE